MFAQLVLTIGKQKLFHTRNDILPPAFLGAFDAEKIAFVPFYEIQHIFYQNDFNWNVTSSETVTKEFRQIYEQVKNFIEDTAPWETYIFDFEKDEKDLRRFVKDNFVVGKNKTAKIKIDKNNFITIFDKWLKTVQPAIQFNWDAGKRHNILTADFYLADLLSDEQNITLLDKIDIVLRATRYEMNRHKDEFGAFASSSVVFNDHQKAHNQFWAKYERPPKEEYWDFIIERRPLLVPQDIREVQGSFFTPPQWVELSQQYLVDILGEDWQDDYFVWDCCAGTGNLLAGLVNKDRIYASTLDERDVKVMFERIERGANLWKQQVFQFDFLNDDFLPESKGGKLPDELYNIISDEKKRRKLLVYINPPYGEAANTKAIFGTGRIKDKIATEHKTKGRFKTMIGAATNDIASHFLARIYYDIPSCKLALFSKVKFICAQNYIKFRQFFKADFMRGFAVKSDSFDNVDGHFPISFTVWDLEGTKFPEFVETDVPEENTKKKFYDGLHKSINQWIKHFSAGQDNTIGYLIVDAPDFQKIHQPFMTLKKTSRHAYFFCFDVNNLIEGCIYFAVRLCIKATWLNDRDQFYYPNDSWKNDIEFQNDCLAFTLFHGQNRISVKDGVNHWIPFVEKEIKANYKFESHTITNFITGERKRNGYTHLFAQLEEENSLKREFSKEAKDVFEAGKAIWIYYHRQPNVNVNASFYDIKEFFKGRNEKGNVNSKAENQDFDLLEKELTAKLKILSRKIEPKVYEYGFLLA
ncbi:MAG: hypothetical protein LBE91_19905 [Tannerella sp.]|nr:hypothetical protein [Tannerella sp.]